MFYCIYFFLIGAFMGWILECVFKALTKNFERAPGILNSPFCILYGIGTLLLSTVIPMLSKNLLLIFLVSAVVLTFCEYITYVLLKKMYNISLWDYSEMPLKINEKVCVEFAVIWGGLGVIYVNFLLPLLKNIFFSIDGTVTNLILLILFSLISLDLLYTNERLIQLKLQLDK